MAEKQRVEYIDLMKGIVILLVVIGHCSLSLPEHLRHMLAFARMPLFVFMSGLFFSTYGGSFKQLLVKKLSKLMVPYITFKLVFVMLLPFTNEYFSIGMLKSIVYQFLTKADIGSLNTPLWFLVLLFVLALLGYGAECLLKKHPKLVRLGVVTAVSFVAFLYNNYLWDSCPEDVSPDRICFLYKICLIQALILLPLYYAAYLFRDKILCPHKPLYMWLMLPIALVVWYFMVDGPVWHFGGYFPRNYIKLWLVQLAGIYVVYFVGYMLKRVPYLSYVGRYSLVVLVTHIIVIKFSETTLHIHDGYAHVAIVFATAPALIWLLTRYMPHFTAQKDLIRLDEKGKIKISFTD